MASCAFQSFDAFFKACFCPIAKFFMYVYGVGKSINEFMIEKFPVNE